MLIGAFFITFLVLCLPFLIYYLSDGISQFFDAFLAFLIIDVFLFFPFIVYFFFRIRYIKKIGDKMKVTEIVLNDCVSKIYGLMVFVTKIPDSHLTAN